MQLKERVSIVGNPRTLQSFSIIFILVQDTPLWMVASERGVILDTEHKILASSDRFWQIYLTFSDRPARVPANCKHDPYGKFFLHYLYFGAGYASVAGGIWKRDNPGCRTSNISTLRWFFADIFNFFCSTGTELHRRLYLQCDPQGSMAKFMALGGDFAGLGWA